ncbi:EscU/YscU/HrcU family type III secretion system export apparatus switch protein [Sediminibacillus sp. JSM 1682029]|uniref:EscU/YscU/HrcU family type III secretion system export apparatus switch protein n=1 Tax=Sediminibacillus sp. JSM 1682029 TaxID=3229857 RepID=UPI003524DB79
MKSQSPKRKAAALRYEGDKAAAPKVTAAGKGYVADNIIAKAEAADVPIQEDSTLVELLAELNINETIPEELYQAVAEVFAFVYRADRKL